MESGDILVAEGTGRAFRLQVPTGMWSRGMGELYPKEIKKLGYRAIAEGDKNGELTMYWVPIEQTPLTTEELYRHFPLRMLGRVVGG